MIKTIFIIILVLILLHFICGVICIFFYLDKSTRMHFNMGDMILMLIFGPLITIIFGFFYLICSISTMFNKLKNKIYERKAKI